MKNKKIRFKNYRKNLHREDNIIYSYNTPVATIDHTNKTVKANGYYSRTTSKHVGYVARLLGYSLIK